MKLYPIIISVVALTALCACGQKKSVPEKAEDKVKDALDQRPAEQVRDAVEDAGDAIKDAAEEVKDKVNDALDRRPAEKLQDAAEDVEDAAKEAADSVKESINQ